MKRVLVAMSGGVDSSVTAAILKEKGHEVIGVTMQIWPHDTPQHEGSTGCCGLGAVEDARRVAEKLDIPHYVVNFRKHFQEDVIENFCAEYAGGRTPNPCIRCNEHIKFKHLRGKAKELEADFLATGHYARIEYDRARSRYIMRKGKDRNKDQSYFLYVMRQEELAETLMPLGDITKEKTRQIAADLELSVAERPESQEICFIPDNDYANFLRRRVPEACKPGPIFDKEGNKLGQHKGIAAYTLGQRRGIGIAYKEPLYVADIDCERNAVTVGTERDMYSDELTAKDANFIAIKKLHGPMAVTAKIRYNTREAEATISPMADGGVAVNFKDPQKAITPGQAVVFYKDDVVIGGGTISWRKIKD